MPSKIEFKLIDNTIFPVSNGGDAFIETKNDETKIFLYSGSTNITKAGRIAVELLRDGDFKTPNTAMVYVSHPLSEIDTVEMIACQWVLENRTSDDGFEIIAWLESIGLKGFEARRMYDLFFRFVMYTAFKGVELVFTDENPSLVEVS